MVHTSPLVLVGVVWRSMNRLWILTYIVYRISEGYERNCHSNASHQPLQMYVGVRRTNLRRDRAEEEMWSGASR